MTLRGLRGDRVKEDPKACRRVGVREDVGMTLCVLPPDAFDAFGDAISAPGKRVPGLARAAKATEGMLRDAGDA